MSSSRIPPSSSIVDLVRAVAAERVSKQGLSRASAEKGKEGGRTAGSDPARSLRRRLEEVVGRVNVGDHEAMRKVRRSAIREILLWEFGADFDTDPGFMALHRAIDDLMEADPKAAASFGAMVKSLNGL